MVELVQENQDIFIDYIKELNKEALHRFVYIFCYDNMQLMRLYAAKQLGTLLLDQ